MKSVRKTEEAIATYRRSFRLQGSTEPCFSPTPGFWEVFLNSYEGRLSV